MVERRGLGPGTPTRVASPSGAGQEGWEEKQELPLGAWCPGKLIWVTGGRRTPTGGGVRWGVYVLREGFIEVVEKSFGNLSQGPIGPLQVILLITAQAKPAQREWGRRPAQKVSFPGNCPSFVHARNRNTYLALRKALVLQKAIRFFFFSPWSRLNHT